MNDLLPPIISEDLATLLPKLTALGFKPAGCRVTPEHFGNYIVEFEGKAVSFGVTRDRGQYLIEGEQTSLSKAGLFHAFEDKRELERDLLFWLETLTDA